MRLGPLFLVTSLYIWAFLAAVAWALVAIVPQREPRLATLAVALLAGAAGVMAAILLGGRGPLSLVLSFPLCFAAALVACIAAGRRERREVGP